MTPLARKTSASTVGLPRLSRISRAVMSRMVGIEWREFSRAEEGGGRIGSCDSEEAGLLFRPFTFAGDGIFAGRDPVLVTQRRRHRLPHGAHELRALLVAVARGRHRLQEVNVDDAGPYAKCTLRLDADRAVQHDGDDRCPGADGEDERTLLERPQVIVAAARPFRADDDAPAATHVVRGRLVRVERRAAVGTLDEDDARRAAGGAEERDLRELRLGDEGVAGQDRREHEDVEPAHMVGDVDSGAVAHDALLVMQPRLHAGGAAEGAGPRLLHPVVDAAPPVGDAEQPGDDDDRAEDGGEEDEDEGDEEGTHQLEKWSCPCPRATRDAPGGDASMPAIVTPGISPGCVARAVPMAVSGSENVAAKARTSSD